MKSPEQTRAECEEREARVMRRFDWLDAEISRICGAMRADGILPDRRNAPRADELDGLGYASGHEPKPEISA